MGGMGPQCAVLGSAHEHLDEVIVQSIVELTLELPFKLRVIKVARVERKDISVGRGYIGGLRCGDIRGLRLDKDLDAVVSGLSSEVEQGMLVEPELLAHALKTGVRLLGHCRTLY